MPFVVTDGKLRSATGTDQGPTGRPRILSAPLAGHGLGYLKRVVAYDAIYRSQPAVRSVVDFLAKNVAGLKANLFTGDEAEREALTDHALRRLIRQPNPRRSRFAFYRSMVSDIAIYDAHLAVKVKLAKGPALVRIPPIHVKILGNSYLEPAGFAITDGYGRTLNEIPPEQALYVRGYSPSSDSRGVAPMETLRQVIAEELASTEYREGLWRNGARVSGIITRPVAAPAWSDPARDRFLEDWSAQWSADAESAGGTPLLEEGMEFIKVTMSAVEAEYIAARELAREEVDSVYHVDGRLLGYGGEVNAETRRGLYADTLGPWCQWIGEELGLALIPDFPDLDPDTDYIELNLEAKLRGHFLDQAEVISRSTGAPWLVRNEARALFNRKPLPGGDELIVPLNVTVGGRASPADTAPGAPGLGQVSPPKALDAIDVASREADPSSVDRRHGTKAAGTPGGQLPVRLRPWVGKFQSELDEVLAKARAVVQSRIGAGATMAAAFSKDRWRPILAEKARAVTYALATAEAEHTIDELDADPKAYDADLLLPALEEGANVFARSVTNALAEALSKTPLEKARSAKDLGDDGPTATELVDDTFASFTAGAMLTAIATRVVGVANFTRTDVAEKAGRKTKRWVVNSGNPRSSHAKLAGAEAAIGETFANGARWPGDSVLPAFERANCTCTVEFS